MIEDLQSINELVNKAERISENGFDFDETVWNIEYVFNEFDESASAGNFSDIVFELLLCDYTIW